MVGGGNGLKHGLPMPVRGQVQGRFGVDRPDGGVWRGVVLRAPEGTPVKAVAPGTVVYAEWLRGFGNLIIVDHGQQYLTVYATTRACSSGWAIRLAAATPSPWSGRPAAKWNPAYTLKFAIAALLSTRPSGWRSRSVPVQYIIGSHSLVHP